LVRQHKPLKYINERNEPLPERYMHPKESLALNQQEARAETI
jgi:hypothetical protein